MTDMKKTWFGLSIPFFISASDKKAIVDNYIDLVCIDIRNMKYEKVNKDIIQDDIIEYFGVYLSSSTIKTVLTAMVEENFLTKTGKEYTVLLKAVEHDVF